MLEPTSTQEKHKILDLIITFLGILIIKIVLSALYGYAAVFWLKSLQPIVIYFDTAFLFLTLLLALYFWNKKKFASYGLLGGGLLMLLSILNQLG